VQRPTAQIGLKVEYLSEFKVELKLALVYESGKKVGLLDENNQR
jgi:hypothetical protein